MTGKNRQVNMLLKSIIDIIKDMKGINIMSLDFRKIENPICEYFIICTGSSETHVNAIEKKITKKIEGQLKEKPWSTEGNTTSNWLLIDYTDIVIHIFKKETRDFYQLEDLWGDAKITTYLDKEKTLSA